MDFLSYESDEESTANIAVETTNNLPQQKTVITSSTHHTLLSKLPPLLPNNSLNLSEYQGRDLTEQLRGQKMFNNPYILSTIVKTLDIDEVCLFNR